eukprot:gnl/Chilomastix_cuspidata/5077.p1 GENE.gnl/Chilomastix_cuspidata/5077~~gnl/Chilomastix_cuspidata/5077.p1  ORF type:complete len:554 (-),score=215.68 gnl/Chilomastix_cuspidata/5077:101-1762(-)
MSDSSTSSPSIDSKEQPRGFGSKWQTFLEKDFKEFGDSHQMAQTSEESPVNEKPAYERLYDRHKIHMSQQKIHETLTDPSSGQRMYTPEINQHYSLSEPREGEAGARLYLAAMERKKKTEESRQREAQRRTPQVELQHINTSSIRMVHRTLLRKAKKEFGRALDKEQRAAAHGQAAPAQITVESFWGLLANVGYDLSKLSSHARLFMEVQAVLDPRETGFVAWPPVAEFLNAVYSARFVSTAVEEHFQHLIANATTDLLRVAAAFAKHIPFSPSATRSPPRAAPPEPAAAGRKVSVERSRQAVDRLLSHHERAQQNHEKRREHKMKKEIAECTFQPVLKAQQGAHAPPSAAQSVSERLFALSAQERAKKHSTREEKELEECTFRPRINPRRSSAAAPRSMTGRELLSPARAAPGHTPRRQPKGYRESIERVKLARLRREQDRKEFENLGKVKELSPALRVPKPFTFRTEQRAAERVSNPPLLYIDVNIGGGRSGRIGVRSGDTPSALARKFAREHQLDASLQSTLESVILDHMRHYIPEHLHSDGDSLRVSEL